MMSRRRRKRAAKITILVEPGDDGGVFVRYDEGIEDDDLFQACAHFMALLCRDSEDGFESTLEQLTSLATERPVPVASEEGDEEEGDEDEDDDWGEDDEDWDLDEDEDWDLFDDDDEDEDDGGDEGDDTDGDDAVGGEGEDGDDDAKKDGDA